MKYSFKNQVTPIDFFVMGMANAYRMPLCVINVIFAVSVVIMTVNIWDTVNDFIQVLLLILCLVFPVFQPWFLFMRSKKMADMLPQDMTLSFDDYGLRVTVGDKKEDIRWHQLGYTQKKRYVIVFSDPKHGYIINNKMMGKQKAEFIEYLGTKIK